MPANLTEVLPEVEPTDATRARQVEPTVELDPVTSRQHRLAHRVRLRVLAGPDADTVTETSTDRFVIGTDEAADLGLHDPTVSRFHCSIEIKNEQLLLTDLDSLNGTMVDGTPIISAFLRDGAVIEIGHSRIRTELARDPIRIALSGKERFGSMIGRSTPMREAFALLERAASSDIAVLLEGETGTGKEAAAESIHLESSRREGPLIVVDCGAIPDNLIESELFGHVRGSFTGATTARQGAFEAAAGGTIFLDEVGELGLELQPKLLRALEKHEIKRVGETRYLPVNVRVIAATNRNLRTEVNARRFRSDLYYRLAVLEVRLPPLRDRPGDLAPIVEQLLSSMQVTEAQAAPLKSPGFYAQLSRHSWPGNVRELRNYVERCLALRDQPPLAETKPEGSEMTGPIQPIRNARDAFERRYLEALLKTHEGNLSAAARVAGIDRANLYRMLWRHGLR